MARLLRDAGWAAGWAQPYICGRDSWEEWMVDADDERLRLRSHGLPEDVVRELRGVGVRARKGHPDVIAWRGDLTVFVEYKSAFEEGTLNQNQIDWFHEAARAGLADATTYVVAKQDPRSSRP